MLLVDSGSRLALGLSYMSASTFLCLHWPDGTGLVPGPLRCGEAGARASTSTTGRVDSWERRHGAHTMGCGLQCVAFGVWYVWIIEKAR